MLPLQGPICVVTMIDHSGSKPEPGFASGWETRQTPTGRPALPQRQSDTHSDFVASADADRLHELLRHGSVVGNALALSWSLDAGAILLVYLPKRRSTLNFTEPENSDLRPFHPPPWTRFVSKFRSSEKVC